MKPKRKVNWKAVARKLKRDIEKSQKLKTAMQKRLGMTPQQSSKSCGDDIY